MRTTLLRPLLALIAIAASALGSAGTLVVTSPGNGGYLGKSSTVTFNLTGMTAPVTVTATATSTLTSDVNERSTTVALNTDGSGTGSGSITLPFADDATEGTYTLTVTAVEKTTSNSYAPVTETVTVDVTDPTFLSLTPVDGGYTRGLVKIRANVEEANPDTWTVEVGGQVIARGTGNQISADKDFAGVKNDGPQSITITVTDKAGNALSKSLDVTLDRLPPSAKFASPVENQNIGKGRDVIVQIIITDATSGVDRTGVDVVAKRTDGVYITRVTFVMLSSTSATTQQWVGRIRYQKGLLPSKFKITVNTTDRAGNSILLPPSVTVRYGQ